jgi:hypothetical protein
MLSSGTPDISSQAIRVFRILSGQREQSRPKHDVTGGIMMLAESKRIEPTLLIRLNEHALQSHPHIRYKWTRQILHWQSIGTSRIKSIMQAK